MNCYQAQLKIDDYLDDRLNATEQREFLAHALNCDACRVELELARRLHRDLPIAAPYNPHAPVRMSAAQRTRIRERIVGQRGSNRFYGLLPAAHPFGQLALNLIGVFLILFVVIAAATLMNKLRPGPPPPSYQASFAYAQKQGLTYIFTDTTATADPLTYRWDFGDGITATLRNPEHNFARPTTYLVSLTVHGERGSDGHIAVSVKVGETAVASATPTPLARIMPSPTLPVPVVQATLPLAPTDAPNPALSTSTPAPIVGGATPPPASRSASPAPPPISTPPPANITGGDRSQPAATPAPLIEASVTAGVSLPSVGQSTPNLPPTSAPSLTATAPNLTATTLPATTSTAIATLPPTPSEKPASNNQTVTPLPSRTAMPSSTPLPSSTPMPSSTPQPPSPTELPPPSFTPTPTSTPTTTATATATNTPTATATNTPTSTHTATATATATSTPRPTITRPPPPPTWTHPPPPPTWTPRPTRTPHAWPTDWPTPPPWPTHQPPPTHQPRP